MTAGSARGTSAAETLDAPRAIRLAVPWLTREAAGDAAGADLEAARWLVSRGRFLPEAVQGWRAWLLGGTARAGALLEHFPAGPCVRALLAGEASDETWACATPVRLLTAIDHLQMAPPGAIELEVHEAAAIDATLRDHFSGADHSFVDDTQGGWLWRTARDVQCASVEPERAVGRNLREVMPAGRDARAVSSLMNELQMLLHEHPVNERRVARGDPAVNALWLWGFGRAGTPTMSLPRLFSDDRWLAGLARLHDSRCGSLPEFSTSPGGAGAATAIGWSRVSPRSSPTDELLEVERRCFRPIRDAFVRGRLDRVELLLGTRGLQLTRSGRWRFWRRARPLAEVLP